MVSVHRVLQLPLRPHVVASGTPRPLDDGLIILGTSESFEWLPDTDRGRHGRCLLRCGCGLPVAGGRVLSSHWLLQRVVLHAKRWS